MSEILKTFAELSFLALILTVFLFVLVNLANGTLFVP